MGRLRIGLMVWLIWAGAAQADLATTRPQPRPDSIAPVAATPALPQVRSAAQAGVFERTLGPVRSIRPPGRPQQIASLAPAPAPAQPTRLPNLVDKVFPGTSGPTRTIRPLPRPQAAVLRSASAEAPRKGGLAAIFGRSRKGAEAEPEARPRKGSVCGDTSIRGEEIARIVGKVKGCGIAAPVRVTEVAGVRLSTAATIDCDTARALRTWVTKGLTPAFGKGQVKELRVVAHYACRTRNNQRGARISEHGRGKAIDIAGIKLASGGEISVLGDFRRSKGDAMRRAYKAACGIFGTTLGPGSDRFHNDHMHLDTARHRGGPYCR